MSLRIHSSAYGRVNQLNQGSMYSLTRLKVAIARSRSPRPYLVQGTTWPPLLNSESQQFGRIRGYSAGEHMSHTITPSGRAVNPWWIGLTLTMATFMELLDTSIANVSLPHIAGGLGTSLDEATWVLTSYLVANAVVLPLSAWLSRVFGRKNYYMTCVALFTCASFLCGVAPNLGLLIFFRVLQGVAGGGLAPSEQSMLVDAFPASKRAAAFGLYSMAIVCAPALGPTLGGWITDNSSWRWIFFINIPVGVLSLFLTSQLVTDPPAFTEERQRIKASGNARIDYVGILLFAVGFGALEVVLDKGQEDDWFGSSFITTFTVISVIALVVAIIWELHHKDPVVDLSLLTNRNFALACALLPFWIHPVQYHRADASAPANARQVRRHLGWYGPDSWRSGYRSHGAFHRAAHPDCRSETTYLHRVLLLRGCSLAPESSHAAGRLLGLCTRAHAARIWARVSDRPDYPGGLFLSSA